MTGAQLFLCPEGEEVVGRDEGEIGQGRQQLERWPPSLMGKAGWQVAPGVVLVLKFRQGLPGPQRAE